MADLNTQTPAHGEITRDLVVGGASIGLAIVGAVAHITQGGRLHDDFGAEPGPALLPELLLTALLVVGGLLVLRGFLAKRSERTEHAAQPVATALAHPDPSEADMPARALSVLLTTIVFALLQTVFGFGVTAVLLGATLCAALGWSEQRALLRSAFEGGAIAGILYLTFRYLLSVPLT